MKFPLTSVKPKRTSGTVPGGKNGATSFNRNADHLRVFVSIAKLVTDGADEESFGRSTDRNPYISTLSVQSALRRLPHPNRKRW